MGLTKLYYSIGEVSHLTGVPETTLRYWDKKGLLHPSRRDGKRRFYTQKDLEKARKIKELTDEGLTLEGVARRLARTSNLPPEITQEIREILALVRKLMGKKREGLF
ncbi:MAG: helix-turn-helix domain-containing protein [candidate division WOR-3 bacterium]